MPEYNHFEISGLIFLKLWKQFFFLNQAFGGFFFISEDPILILKGEGWGNGYPLVLMLEIKEGWSIIFFQWSKKNEKGCLKSANERLSYEAAELEEHPGNGHLFILWWNIFGPIGYNCFMSRRRHYFSYCIALAPTHSCTDMWVWACRNKHCCGKYLLFTPDSALTQNGWKGDLGNTRKISRKRFLEESDKQSLEQGRHCARALSTLMCFICSVQQRDYTRKSEAFCCF